jgi:hypothetical protein
VHWICKLAPFAFESHKLTDVLAISHQSKPIFIINRRWEPVTAVSSAGISTFINLADASLGLITKPYMAYQKNRPYRIPPSELASTGDCSETSIDFPPSYSTIDLITQQTTKLKLKVNRPGSVPPEAVEVASFNHVTIDRCARTELLARNAAPKYSIPVTGSNGQLNESCALVGGSSNETRTALTTTVAIAAASGKSVGYFFLSFAKGALVDIPLAAAEGLRVVPHMYGEELRDYDYITDWKSGFEVAGKAVRHGMYEGLTGVFVLPCRELQVHGALGVATGFAKGILGLATKTSSAAIGLVAYPAEGVTQSIRSSFLRRTWKTIGRARLLEGEWLTETEAGRAVDQDAVLRAFDCVRKGKGWT